MSLLGSVLSPVTSVISELSGANNIAKAQGAAAGAQLQQQQADRTSALKFADSADEITQLQNAVATSNQDISRQQKILDSTDPAVIEAGKQALQMMKGVESGTLAPIRDQRNRDRMALQNKLLKQLGPGYENTTAGAQALADFDKATTDSLATAQQTAINSYLGTAQGFSAQGLNSQVAQQATLGGMYGNIANRKIGALQSNPVDPALGYAGQIAGAQAQQQSFGQLLQLGGIAAGAGLFGGASAGLGLAGTAGSTANNLTVNGIAPAGGFNLGVPGGGSSGYSFGNMLK